MTQTCSYRHTYSYPAILPESLWFSGARLLCVFQLLHLCLLGEGPSLAPSAWSGKAHRVPEVPGDQTSHLGFNPWLMGADASQLWLPPPLRGRLRRGSCTASQRNLCGTECQFPMFQQVCWKKPRLFISFFPGLPPPSSPMCGNASQSNCRQVSGTLPFSRP